MNSDDISTAQAKKVYEALGPTLGYLCKLHLRLQRLGFPRDDKLYDLVLEAHDHMHRLCIELHYMSCTHGAGRPDRE